MRTVFFIVIAAAVAIVAAWWLAGLPGTVSVSLSGYTVQLATSLAVVGVAILVLALYCVVRLLGWIFGTPARVGFWRRRRRRSDGDEAITRTLVAIAAGAEGEARRASAKARKMLGDTPQTLLLAAEAGRLAKRDDEATALYTTLAARDDAALLGLRGLFRQAMNREAWSEAAAIAERAETVHPGAAWLRDERAQLAVRIGNWRQALHLAGPDSPREAYATAAADAEPDPDEALRLARRVWKDNPGFTPAALAYARRLRDCGKDVKALQTIREAWAANPQPELAAFSLDPMPDKMARIREATRIITHNPDHPESQFLLARLSLEADLTGEARHHLEQARRAGLTQKRLWLMLADIEQREHGETEAGQAAQRDALRHAAMADPDPAWRCDACGTEHAHWLPICPSCHTAGRVRWSARQMALVAG
jgi:HemY protein